MVTVRQVAKYASLYGRNPTVSVQTKVLFLLVGHVTYCFQSALQTQVVESVINPVYTPNLCLFRALCETLVNIRADSLEIFGGPTRSINGYN